MHVGHPGLDHHLGLTDLGATDPNRPGGKLLACPVRALRRLEVRPHVDAHLVGRGLEFRDVGFSNIEVHNDAGGVEFIDGCSRQWEIISHLFSSWLTLSGER